MSLDVFERLSPREQQVLFALMKGRTAREICEREYLSMPTVRSQIHAILSKLGVSTQLAAVVLAYRNSWLPESERPSDPRPAV